jgi:hypothetical protein
MNPPHLNADTEALLQGYLEGTLTPEDSTRLLTSLKSQPELVGVVLDGLRMDAVIREVVSRSAAATRTASKSLRPERAAIDPTSTRIIASSDETLPNADPLPENLSDPCLSGWLTNCFSCAPRKYSQLATSGTAAAYA